MTLKFVETENYYTIEDEEVILGHLLLGTEDKHFWFCPMDEWMFSESDLQEIAAMLQILNSNDLEMIKRLVKK